MYVYVYYGRPDRPCARRSHIIMGVVNLGRACECEQAHSQLFLVFDVYALSEGGERFYYYILTMSLYRFFAKAGMPLRVPSLSDKEIENANASVKKLQEKVKSARSALVLCACAVRVRVDYIECARGCA